MSVPQYCSKCGDIIGEIDGDALLAWGMAQIKGLGDFDSRVDVQCPGRGNHPKPSRHTTTRLFGWLCDVRLTYPETGGDSSWSEYVGPPSKFCLWLAMMFSHSSSEGLVINHKWVWWGWDRLGFYGDGLEELTKPALGQQG